MMIAGSGNGCSGLEVVYLKAAGRDGCPDVTADILSKQLNNCEPRYPDLGRVMLCS